MANFLSEHYVALQPWTLDLSATKLFPSQEWSLCLHSRFRKTEERFRLSYKHKAEVERKGLTVCTFPWYISTAVPLYVLLVAMMTPFCCTVLKSKLISSCVSIANWRAENNHHLATKPVSSVSMCWDIKGIKHISQQALNSTSIRTQWQAQVENVLYFAK